MRHRWHVDSMQGESQINNDEHTELAWFSFDPILKIKLIFPEDIAIYHSLECG